MCIFFSFSPRTLMLPRYCAWTSETNLTIVQCVLQQEDEDPLHQRAVPNKVILDKVLVDTAIKLGILQAIALPSLQALKALDLGEQTHKAVSAKLLYDCHFWSTFWQRIHNQLRWTREINAGRDKLTMIFCCILFQVYAINVTTLQMFMYRFRNLWGYPMFWVDTK